MSPSSPPHADDLLSAHLDDELDAPTDAWVVDHLRACAECRDAADELAEARAAVRSLPTVDASSVIEGVLARHRSLIRLGGAFVGVAALVLAALGATAATHRPEVVPDLARMTATHVDAAHHELGGVRAVDGSAGYAAPAGLIGSSAHLSRQAVYDGTDLTVIVYRDVDVDVDVSIFEQPGRLDWGAMPAGRAVDVADQRVWLGVGEPVVAVAEVGDLVVTVVSEDRAAVLTAVASLPEWRRRAVWDRLHDACQRFTRVFALDG